MIRLIILLVPLLSLTDFDAPQQNTRQRVLELLKNEMKTNGIPGLQIAVIKNNELILSEALGYSNVPFSVKTNQQTIFSINSIAKIFAATAIMQLAEHGKLGTNDPISNYLPALPTNWHQITIEQLLSHTSGLPDIEDTDNGDLIGGKGLQTAWSMVQKMPLVSKPGLAFSYNATNYLLLEKVIEKLEGMDFEKFIQEKQFKPAGMKQTFYGNSAEVVVNKGPTYSFYYFDKTLGDYVKGKQLLEVEETFPIKADAGAFGSAEEMAKWVIALQTGKFLSKESIEKMWRPVALNNGEYDGFGGLLNAYALGWPVIQRDTHPGVSPFGGGRASFTIYPKDDVGIILFTNLSGLPTYEIVETISKFYLK